MASNKDLRHAKQFTNRLNSTRRGIVRRTLFLFYRSASEDCMQATHKSGHLLVFGCLTM